MKKSFLFTPGPTPVPEAVLAALSQPILNHRSSEFKEIIGGLRTDLKKIWQTKNEVLILTCSGTGAMEGAISSTLKQKDRVAVVNAGKFGERFSKIAKSFELELDEIKVEWGSPVSLKEIEAALQKEPAAFCFQMSETSTGTLHPYQEICEWIRKKFPECLLIVDGITAVGAMSIATDKLDIDILISGSQKAFMLPPGLAFASISPRALAKMKSSNLPKFYLDFAREHKSILENQTAFTPSISLIVALKAALKMMNEEGLENVYARHSRLSLSTQKALLRMNLKMATQSPSVACTTMYLPNGVDGKKLLKKIETEYGFRIAGGQDQWEGKVIRLSHLGFYTAFDLLSALTALSRSLLKEGHSHKTEEVLQTFIETYDL